MDRCAITTGISTCSFFHSLPAGLVASVLMAIVPGYISRSVAGSFDNEAVAIFALLLTFYLFVRAVRVGTLAAGESAGFRLSVYSCMEMPRNM